MPKRVKVLYVINDLGVGGAQRILSDLINGLDKNTFEPIVYNLNFSGGKEIEKELLQKKIKVVNFQSLKIGDFRCIWPIYKFIKNYHIRIVHSHLCLASFFASVAARMAGVRCVVSTEHNTTTFLTRPLYYRSAARIYLHLNAFAIAISGAVRRSIESISQTLGQKIRIVYNGIDLNVFDPSRYKYLKKKQQLGVNAKFRVGTLVRDDPRKGFAVFVACAQIMGGEGEDMEFVAGSRERASFDAPGVRTEMLSPGIQGVAKFLAALDVFVLPSLEEGLGLAAIEAMAMGVPVVASAVGGLPEVIENEKEGLLVEPGNPVALKDAILRLKRDEDFARLLAQQGQRKAHSQFSVFRMCQEVEKLYRHLLEKCG